MSSWDIFLHGIFSWWDFVLWDFVLMGFFPLGFFPHGIFSYMGFCPHGILSGYPSILMKLWSSCLLEAVRTNPGYGMATLIYNFWRFLRIIFRLCEEARLNFYISKTVSRIPNFFKIKYYKNIWANFLLYFNVNVYFITIVHYLNN